MKTKQILGLIAGCLFGLGVRAQIFSDDFSVPSNWTPPAGNQTLYNPYPPSASPGMLTVSNSQLEFRGFRGSQTYRLQKDINHTFNANDKWRLEYEFTPITLNSDNGAVIGLTNNTNHWQSDLEGGGKNGRPLNNTSSIHIVYTDVVGPLNKRIKLKINAKYLNTYSHSGSNEIDVYLNNKYYVRAERLAADKVVLSVYSDPSHTIHVVGSPVCYNIDPRITGLRYVQVSQGTTSGYDRIGDVNIDNMKIFDNTIERCWQPSCFINPNFTFEEGCQGQVFFTNNSTMQGHHLKTLLNDGKSGLYSFTELGLGEDFSIQYTTNGTYNVCITVFGNYINYQQSLQCCSSVFCDVITVTTANEPPCEGDGGYGSGKIKKSESTINLSEW